MIKRFASIFLSGLMLTSVFFSAVSCKKKSSAPKKTVSDTSPWFTTTRVELDAGIVTDENTMMWPNGPWMSHDKYVMQYMVMDETGFHNEMGVFDQSGKLLSMVDIDELLVSLGNFRGFYPIRFCEGEKGIRIFFTNMITLHSCEVDPDTGLAIGSAQKFDFSSVMSEDELSDEKPENYHISSALTIGGYDVVQLTRISDGRSTLVVAKNGNSLYMTDFDKALGPGEMQFIQNYYGGGNGTVIIEGLGKSSVTGILDLATGQLTKAKEAKPISDNQRISTSHDGTGYLTKATGIFAYDVTSGEETCKFNFDDCAVNRFETQRAEVLSFEENTVILGCYAPPVSGYATHAPAVVYTLQKADKNPNVGKGVITVATLGDSLTYLEAEALRLFNEQNPDYFAQLVLYDQGDYIAAGDVTANTDETDRKMYNAMAMVSGTLTSDIRSGSGPDVIFGAAQSIDLLDSRYLMDLSSYLEGKSFDASAYYSNLINVSKMDGKAYFIPTSFTIAGIVTDGSGLGADQMGFTYDQYASFVSGQMNGVEPVTQKVSRLHFLNMCIERNYSQWLKENRMDFDQDGFRELSAFFKDTIPEGVTVTSEAEDAVMELYDVPVYADAFFLENICCVQDLAHINFYGDNLRIYGLPSSDGTGPTANIVTSFSITAGSGVEDAAYTLLDLMLSEEVQKQTRDAIPMNRAAVLAKLEKEKEINQNGYAQYMDNPDSLLYDLPDLMREASIFEPDSSLPDVYLKALDSVNSVFLSDSSVMMIVSEEIPAYLLGQKDIGSVISTLNNRTKTVFDER